MGNKISCIQKINFEDMQHVLKNNHEYMLINTLKVNEQDCIIPNTISIQEEEHMINNFLKQNKNIKIIIYGKNSNDESSFKKYNQLISLGFINVYLYPGGLFEWFLLQDIYGREMFPTTKEELDILKYKPVSILNKLYLKN